MSSPLPSPRLAQKGFRQADANERRWSLQSSGKRVSAISREAVRSGSCRPDRIDAVMSGARKVRRDQPGHVRWYEILSLGDLVHGRMSARGGTDCPFEGWGKSNVTQAKTPIVRKDAIWAWVR